MSEAEQNQNPGRKSHWRSLAELLGAPAQEVEAATGDSADGSPSIEPVVEAKPAQQEPKPARPLPPRPASDWYSLANELGIEVEPPPPPPEPEPVAQTPPEPEPVAQTPPEPELAAQTPPEPELNVTPEAVAEDGQDDQNDVELAAWPVKAPSVDEPLPAAPDQQVTLDLEVESSDTIDVEFLEESVAARSQLETDVDEDEETEAKEQERPATRRRRRRGRRRGATADTPSADAARRDRNADESGDVDAAGEQSDEGDDKTSDTDQVAPEVGGEDADEPVETIRKRRSRRRRRRSRSGDEPAEATAADAEDKPSGAKPAAAEPAVAERKSEDGADDSSADGDRAKHRKIPTWEESISVIVAANIESRSKNTGSKNTGSKSKPRGSRRRRN